VPAAARLRIGSILAFTGERDEQTVVRMTDSGRYVHSEAHVRAAAHDAGFVVEGVESPVLRYEYGEPVRALVVVMRAP